MSLRTALLVLISGLAACPSPGPGGPDGGATTDAGPAPGAVAVLSDEAVDFGRVEVGTTARRELTLGNEGDADLVVEAVAVDGDVFQVTAPDGPVAPGAEATIVLEAAPTQAGPRTGRAVLSTNGGTGVVALAVTGEVTRPDLAVDASLAFPPLCPGSSLSRTVTFANTGDAPAAVTGLSLTGPDGGAADPSFALGDRTLPLTVEPGAAAEVTVVLTPADAGTHLAELRWTSDDPAHPAGAVSLVGTGDGPGLALPDGPLDFGGVATGTALTRTVVLTSRCEAAVTLGSLAVEGAGFSLEAPEAPITLASGQTLPVAVVFAPTAEGDASGRLVVTTDDPARPEQALALAGQGVSRPGCAAADLVPGRVDLATPSREPRRVLLSLENTGTGACLVRDLRFLPGTPDGFAFVDAPPGPATVAPGAVLTLEVEVPPLADAFSGGVGLYVSDPTGSEREVPFVGTPAPDVGGYVLERVPDLGPAPVGCRTRARPVCVTSRQPTLVTLASFAVVSETLGGHFELTGAPAAGTPLRRGETLCGSLTWTAAQVVPAQAVVEIGIVGRPEPLRVRVGAHGVPPGDVVETFVQAPGGPADVLFVVDDSGSMSERYWLSDWAPDLVEALETHGVDYHLGITTTDVSDTGPRGRLLPRTEAGAHFVDAASPDPVAAFRTLAADIGEVGDALGEAPLEATYLALGGPLAAGWNAGFRRPTARLEVVYLVDEPDQSQGSLELYTILFLGQGAVVSEIYPGDAAQETPRIAGLVAATGGILRNPAVGPERYLAVAAAAAGLTGRFFLSGVASPGAIQATAGGEPLTGWTFDAGLGAVVFEPAAIPAAGETITVTYTPACE